MVYSCTQVRALRIRILGHTRIRRATDLVLRGQSGCARSVWVAGQTHGFLWIVLKSCQFPQRWCLCPDHLGSLGASVVLAFRIAATVDETTATGALSDRVHDRVDETQTHDEIGLHVPDAPWDWHIYIHWGG